jgi:hypothetical protein
VSALVPLHPQDDTFPGEVFLRLAADALDWCGARRADPLPLEGLRERFLPECAFRGRQDKKLPSYSGGGPPLGMTAALGPGSSPGLSMMTMAVRTVGGDCGAEAPGTGTIGELVTGPGAGGCELAAAAGACGAGPGCPPIPPLSITPAASPAAPIAGFQPVPWCLKRIIRSWFFAFRA